MVRNKLKAVKSVWVCHGHEFPAGEVWDWCGTNHNPIPGAGAAVTLPQTRGWLWSVPAWGHRSQQSLSSSRRAAAGNNLDLSSWYSWCIPLGRQESAKSLWLSLFQPAAVRTVLVGSSQQACSILLQGRAALSRALGGSTEGLWVFTWQRTFLVFFSSTWLSALVSCSTAQLLCSDLTPWISDSLLDLNGKNSLLWFLGIIYLLDIKQQYKWKLPGKYIYFFKFCKCAFPVFSPLVYPPEGGTWGNLLMDLTGMKKEGGYNVQFVKECRH